MCKITLSEYERSKHWKEFRHPILWNEKDLVCEICGKRRWELWKRGPNEGKIRPKSRKSFNVHHKHYDNMYREKRSDVMVLCNRCHTLGHELHKSVSTPIYRKLYEQFCEETGWKHKPYPHVKKQKYTNRKR